MSCRTGGWPFFFPTPVKPDFGFFEDSACLPVSYHISLITMQAVFISQAPATETVPYDALMHAGGRPAKKSRSTLGERLREARIKAGLSQAELAERMGTTQPAIAYWERGAQRLRSDVVARLSEILGLSTDELLGTKTRRPPAAQPAGRARQLFDAVSKLPRRQQDKVLDILEPFVAQHAQAREA